MRGLEESGIDANDVLIAMREKGLSPSEILSNHKMGVNLDGGAKEVSAADINPNTAKEAQNLIAKTGELKEGEGQPTIDISNANAERTI